MKTNDIKKGMRIHMRNGWNGTMYDNLRGNTRMAEIEGHYTEIGSVYSHDIIRAQVLPDAQWDTIEHTPAQIKLRSKIERLGL